MERLPNKISFWRAKTWATDSGSSPRVCQICETFAQGQLVVIAESAVIEIARVRMVSVIPMASAPCIGCTGIPW